MNTVEPKTLKGFRDILPAEMLARERVISVIRETYESYGFVPLATPALEAKDVLLGYGEEASKQIYVFKDRDGADVGLRYDLTVPLCRVIAEYPDLPLPFKRYQVESVWRFDKPDPGRFREFIQFDIDTAGTADVGADAEIICALYETLTKLGLAFKIRIGSRKVLNAMLAYAGVSGDDATGVLRVLDKLDKQGLESVLLEFGPGRVDSSGDKIRGLDLPDSQIAKIREYLTLSQETRAAALASARSLLGGIDGANDAISEIEKISEYLFAMGVGEDACAVDWRIARGLAYYTGPVFEAVLVGAEGFGSICGGGRYDDLVGRFTGKNVPATGVSLGVDRLIAALAKSGALPARPSTADALITVMERGRLADYLRIAQGLRAAGIKTEVYMGSEKRIGNQLKYADRQLIPIAVIIGGDEFAAGTASVKDLRVARIKPEDIAGIKDRDEWLKARMGQRTVPLDALAAEIKSILSERLVPGE